MNSLNRVTLIGHVGREPDIRQSQNGERIANLSLATSDNWKDKQTGERKSQTEWHRIAIFNDGLADLIEQYVQKGSKLFIEGQLKTRKWSDQNGQDRYSTEIVLRKFDGKIILLGNRQEQEAPNHSQTSVSVSSQPVADDLDDEIPF